MNDDACVNRAKTNHASACNRPVQLVLFNVHSEKLNVLQVVGEQGDRV